jgi:hypothetical protein
LALKIPEEIKDQVDLDLEEEKKTVDDSVVVPSTSRPLPNKTWNSKK